MKKGIVFSIIFVLLVNSMAFASESNIGVFVNGQKLEFDVPPIVEKGITLVPLRGIFEALGAQVDYDKSSQTITARREGNIVKLPLGMNKGVVNGIVKELTVPAKVVSGRTLVPLRFVSESFGAAVNYNSSSRIVDISSDVKMEIKDIAKKAESIVIIQVFDKDGVELGTGSGVVVNKQGIIVTNYHVIKDAYYASIIDDSGVKFQVSKVIMFDEGRDIAVIQTNATLPAVKIGKSSDLTRGDDVIAIGSPLGVFKNAISTGILGSVIQINDYNYLQITAPISPGSSGGGLFNDRGELVGITTATITSGQSLNLAVPIDDVTKLLKEAGVEVTYSNQNKTFTGYVIESTTVFSAPDFQSKNITNVAKGTEVTVLEENSDWQGNKFFKIRFYQSDIKDNITGYVFKNRIGVR